MRVACCLRYRSSASQTKSSISLTPSLMFCRGGGGIEACNQPSRCDSRTTQEATHGNTTLG